MGALDGKKVLVVGGSSGMGEGAAKLAAHVGAKVTIASRNHDKLAAAAKRIGKGVEPAILDATSDAAVTKFFAEGAVWDHVVISAGGGLDYRRDQRRPRKNVGGPRPGVRADPRQHRVARSGRHADVGPLHRRAEKEIPRRRGVARAAEARRASRRDRRAGPV